MDWSLTYTKKEQEEWLYENGAGKKIIAWLFQTIEVLKIFLNDL